MLLSLIVVVFALAASEASICTTDAGCGANQCCYFKPEFMVVSKRQLVLPKQSTFQRTGVCETYKAVGDHCDVLETANGHCGCGSGLHCGWVPDPTRAAGRRGMVYHPEPGSYQCTKRH